MSRIFTLSGPGGVGKGTLVRELLRRDPQVRLSRSWTSRERRPDEPDNAYVFVSRDEFRREIAAGGFLEWVEFLGNFYGTPKPGELHGKDLLLEIELEGAQHVKSLEPETVMILVEPPSLNELRRRLVERGDPSERIEDRITKGLREIELGRQVAQEVVVNDDVDGAVERLRGILQRYRASATQGST